MSKKCPLYKRRVTYLECLDCDDKVCLYGTERKNEMKELNKYQNNFVFFLRGAKINGEDYQDLKDRKIFDDLSLAVNCFGFPYKEMYEKIVSFDNSKEVFKNIAYTWLYTLSAIDKSGKYDGRNEYSCCTATKLLRTKMVVWNSEVDDIYDYPQTNASIGKIFSYMLIHEHKTLQQTFSKLVFYYFYMEWNNIYGEEYVQKELKRNSLYTDFFKCPLI